jgi:hypothetical protein
MKKTRKYNSDFFSHAKRSMDKKNFEKSRQKGQAKAHELKLKLARELIGLNQTDLKGMTQPEVSKIERRKDLKISTLNKYAKALGMKLKISLISDDDGEEPIAIFG